MSSGSMSASAALHALGLAGRARRVVHRRAGGAVVGQRRRLAVDQLGERPEARRSSPTAKRLVGGDVGLVGRGRRTLGEALVADEHLGLAVADDVGDLGADEVVVDRREVEPDLQRGEVRARIISTPLGRTTATVSPGSRPSARRP